MDAPKTLTRPKTRSSTMNKYWGGAAMILTSFLFVGCSPGALTFLLMPWADDKEPAEFKLAKDKKEVNVVVLCHYGSPEVRLEYQQVDRELGEIVIKHMKLCFDANKEKVKIVPTPKVREYLNQHLDVDKQALGRHFKADYVVVLEVQSLTLFEKGSMGELYRGNTAIDVTVLEVGKDREDSPVWTQNYCCEFPANQPIPVSGSNLVQFRRMFLEQVGKEVSRYFTKVPHDEMMDKRGKGMMSI